MGPSHKQSKDKENDNIDQPLKIDDYTLENVIWFTYLGSVLTGLMDKNW